MRNTPGCPLSMVFIALYLYAWISKVLETGATPRSLADDMLILAIGYDCVRRLRDALDATHAMLEDMGKFAPVPRTYSTTTFRLSSCTFFSMTPRLLLRSSTKNWTT